MVTVEEICEAGAGGAAAGVLDETSAVDDGGARDDAGLVLLGVGTAGGGAGVVAGGADDEAFGGAEVALGWFEKGIVTPVTKVGLAMFANSDEMAAWFKSWPTMKPSVFT